MLIKVNKVIDGQEVTELQLSTEKVIFEDNGVQKEKVIGSEGKQWWLDLADKHENKVIIGFEPVSYQQDVIDRLSEIKGLDLELGLAEKYVMNGEEVDGMLKLKLTEQENVINDLTQLLIDKGLIY